MDPEQQFMQLIINAHLAHGMDELSAKLIAQLFLEPEEISLDELATKTGYSPASVSTTMKYIENFGFVERTRKPKSRKVYFFMNKDILQLMKLQLEKMYAHKVDPVKAHLPAIIKAYKEQSKKSKQSNCNEKLRIMEQYYRQVLVFESLINETTRKLEHAIKQTNH